MPRKPYSAQLMQALGQTLPPGVVATGKPGELYIEGVGVRQFSDMRQDVLYDRVSSIGAAITAGTEYVFFRDISSKTRLATNMSQQSRLPEGQEALVYRINHLPHLNTSVADRRLYLADGYGELVLDDDNRVKSGPIITFPSAYGDAGSLTTTVTSTTNGVLTNGIPSAGAQPRLMLPQYLAEGRTFRFNAKFYEAVTLSAAAQAYTILDCLVTRPVR